MKNSKTSKYFKYIILSVILLGIALNVYLWGTGFIKRNNGKKLAQITEKADKLVNTDSKVCIEEAKKLYEDGLGKASERDLLTKGILEEKIAYADYRLGKYSGATKKYKSALEIYEKLGNEEVNKRKVDVLCELGLLLNSNFREIEEKEEGRAYLKKALKESREMKDVTREVNILTALGNTYYRWGAYDAALKYDEELLNIYKKLADRVGESKTLVKIGWDYFNIYDGYKDKAFDYLKQGIEVAKTSKDKGAEVSALVNTGLFLTKLDEEGSNKYYQEGEEISKNDKNLKKIIYESLMKKYEVLKDEKERTRYETAYKELQVELEKEKTNCLIP